MDREQIDSMLARIAGIRDELMGWESAMREIPRFGEAGKATLNGLIEMKWCLETALEEDGLEPEEE